MFSHAWTLKRVAHAGAVVVATLALFGLSKSQATTTTQDVDMFRTVVLGRAMILYVYDHDDAFPPYFQNYGVCLPNDNSKCFYKSMWQDSLAPYVWTFSAYYAPGEPPTINTVKNYFNLSYGYNYGYLSTLCLSHDPYSQTALGCGDHDYGDPSAPTFFKQYYLSENTKFGRVAVLMDGGGRDFIDANVLGTTVNAPDASPSKKYTFGASESGWGLNCLNNHHKTSGLVTTGKWSDTDGFAPRFSGGGHVTFDDTHVQYLSVAQAAAGTNWNPTRRCQDVRVTDYAAYIWDPRYDNGPQR